MLDEAEFLERAQKQISQHPPSHRLTNEAEARAAIYAHYVPSGAGPFLVDESDNLVRELRARTGSEFLRLKGDMKGPKLSIHQLQIIGDEARAGFASVTGNLGMALYSVRLKRTKGSWVVTYWHLDAVS